MKSFYVAFALLLLISCEQSAVVSSVNLFSEQIPGSKNHGPNGTWWGYNQSKIVRYGNTVYMYVVENENIDTNPNPNAANPSKIAIYRKDGEGSWQRGARLNTSRPGNILLDSDGIVHLIVFEPTYTQSSENGSYGRLKHYWFPNCKTGDITSYQEEIIVDNDGATQGETVNIRVGASIGPDDLIAVSYGLNKNHVVCYKEKTGIKWFQEYAGFGLGSDFYYPYVLASSSGISILAIQDDWVGNNLPNIYQKSQYFEKKNGSWITESIVNLQSHSLAQSRPELADNSDIYLDNSGNINLMYITKLDPADKYHNTFTQATRSGNTWNKTELTKIDSKTNWIRMIEVSGQMYYFLSTWDKVYIKKGINGEYKRLNTPKVEGIYLYLAAPRGGTSASESYIDMLILCGSSNSYPNAKNYYVRISKSELSKL
ncbi:MAG: hypothetical protein CVT93_07090 [Bacteroidetes bacterium HGW-Bacteroidetes-10]|nr:MAG: hypothetical protein CVT93_07090 [Bacteroidetes bacterium HGW-Bacteroidetes-10]